ncbi:MAG: four helix bundle protein [Planctomycetes bacterium]|nr:four helix bundle protein [Planctomycetota bacterium]
MLLNNNTICEISTSWIEKTSIEGLRNSGCGKTRFPFTSWPVKYTNFPFELKKVTANSIDAAHSISRNISEGYCRRSLKEYLNHLNIALGSCGEFHSCYESFKQASQITDKEYEKLDQLHYKVENALLKLIESLQKKQKDKQWEDNLQSQ